MIPLGIELRISQQEKVMHVLTLMTHQRSDAAGGRCALSQGSADLLCQSSGSLLKSPNCCSCLEALTILFISTSPSPSHPISPSLCPWSHLPKMVPLITLLCCTVSFPAKCPSTEPQWTERTAFFQIARTAFLDLFHSNHSQKQF